MTHDSSTTTFAPKRSPWFGGVFALFILVLIAYALMLYTQTQKQQNPAEQGADVLNALAMPEVQDVSPVSNGVTTLTRTFHVPGAYNSGVVPPPMTPPMPLF